MTSSTTPGSTDVHLPGRKKVGFKPKKSSAENDTSSSAQTTTTTTTPTKKKRKHSEAAEVGEAPAAASPLSSSPVRKKERKEKAKGKKEEPAKKQKREEDMEIDTKAVVGETKEQREAKKAEKKAAMKAAKLKAELEESAAETRERKKREKKEKMEKRARKDKKTETEKSEKKKAKKDKGKEKEEAKAIDAESLKPAAPVTKITMSPPDAETKLTKKMEESTLSHLKKEITTAEQHPKTVAMAAPVKRKAKKAAVAADNSSRVNFTTDAKEEDGDSIKQLYLALDPFDKNKTKKRKQNPPKSNAEALNYLHTFYRNREEWKFEKAKQNWILRNTLDLELIPKTYEGSLCTYIASLKGADARAELLKEMQKVVKDDGAEMAKRKRAKLIKKSLKVDDDGKGSFVDSDVEVVLSEVDSSSSDSSSESDSDSDSDGSSGSEEDDSD